MDRTHLRFFTKKTMRALFESCGYEVSAVKGIVPWREKHWLAAIAPPPFKDAVYRQFVIAARSSPQSDSEASASLGADEGETTELVRSPAKRSEP
jgi:hypothetical protein